MDKKSLTEKVFILFLLTIISFSVGQVQWNKIAYADSATVTCSGTSGSPTPVTESDLYGDDITFSATGGGYCVLDEAITGVNAAVSVIIEDGVTLTHTAEDADGITITTTGDFTIENGATIDVDSAGCARSRNPDGSNVCIVDGTGDGNNGNGNNGSGGGAGGGDGGNGQGGTAGGAAYGSNTAPVLFGSGGGSADVPGIDLDGEGGGLIRLDVGGTFTWDGELTADGNANGAYDSTGDYAGGGGAGGSIYVTAINLAGTQGTISATGGAGGDANIAEGGGGGGGRVAIYGINGTSFVAGLSAVTLAAGGTATGTATSGSVGSLYTTNYAAASTPSVSAPISGYYNQSINPTITTSSYSSNGLSHTSSDWKVTTDSSGSTIVWSKDADTTNKESMTVNASNGTFAGALNGETALTAGATYYAFVRYTNSAGDSSWSATSHVFTATYGDVVATNTWDFTNSADSTQNSSNVDIALDSGATYARLTDQGGGTYTAPGLAGFTKMKAITIANAGAELTNYQIVLSVAYDSDMQADFDDIRFTSSDTITEIDYWIESYTASTTAQAWVEVPTVAAAGNTTIYMYYGNGSVSTTSEIDDTFQVGDDFAGASLDAEWTEVTNGGASTGTFSNGEWTKTCDGGSCDFWSGTDLNTGAYVDDPGGTWEAITLLSDGSAIIFQQYGLMNYNSSQDGYMFGYYNTGTAEYQVEQTGNGDRCDTAGGTTPVYLKIANTTGNGPTSDNTYKYYTSADAVTWTQCDSYSATDTMGKVGLVVKEWGTSAVSASFGFFALKGYAATEPIVTWDDESSVALTSWTKRQSIQVYNSNASELTNVQVELSLSYDSDMQADFDDLRFTSSDGTTLIDHWLESKVDSTSATVWVEIPSISASSVVDIYMYYGNAGASSASSADNTMKKDYSTDANLLGQWQFDEGTGTSAEDSSSNSNTGTVVFDGTSAWSGSDSFFSSGNAIQLDGSGVDGVTTPITINTTFTDDFTLETWAMVDELSDGYGWFFGETTGGVFLLGKHNATGGVHYNIGGLGWANDIGTYTAGAWHHFVLAHDKSEANAMKIYIDGALVATYSHQNVSPDATGNVVFGRRGSADEILDGQLDEMRIYTRYLELDEIVAHYNHQQYVAIPLTADGMSGIEQTAVLYNTVQVVPVSVPAYTDLTTFTETLGGNNAGLVKYQTSNNGSSWYYHNGSSWAAVSDDSTDNNTATQVNAYLTDFQTDVGTGNFFFKAFLVSNGTQKVELDSVAVGYDAGAPTGLASLAFGSSTATTATLTWSAATDLAFNHYEIWYGTTQSEVQNRNGAAVEWDNSDDANLATAGTATTTITSLTAGLTYYAKIWAIDDFGNEATITDLSFNTNQSPTVATVTFTQSTAGDGDATVTFIMDDPDDDDTLQAKIEYSLDGGSTWADPTLSTTGSETTATYGDPSIDNAQTYQVGQAGAYITSSSGANTVTIVWEAATDVASSTDISNAQIRVTPYDAIAVGSAQASSNAILDIVDPAALASFASANASSASVDLSWTAATDTNFNHYEIWYGSNQTDVQGRTGTAAEWDDSDDTDLTTVTTATTTVSADPRSIYFKVFAVDDFGNETTLSDILVSVSYTGGEDADIGIPTNISVTDNASGGVTITWTDPDDSGSTYVQVMRGISPYPVNASPIANIPVGTQSFTDTTPTTGQIVTYMLRASDGSDSGELTAQYVFTVGAADEPETVTDTGSSGGGGGGGGSSSNTDDDEEEEVVEEEIKLPTSLEELGVVAPDHWSEGYLKNLDEVEQVLTQAVETESFYDLLIDMFTNPDKGMSRGLAVQLLVTLSDYNVGTITVHWLMQGFIDVTQSHDLGSYIQFAYEHSLINGYPDGTFGADNVINRAEALKMAMYFFGIEVDANLFGNELLAEYGLTSNPFSDVDIEAWYAPYVIHAYDNGVVRGYGNGTFGPDNQVTYAEFVKIATLINDIENAVELASELE